METERLHDLAISDIQSKYLALLTDFNQEHIKLDKVKQQLLVEDEQRQRINTLLKGQLESLESKNQLLIESIEKKDLILVEKDSVIRSLRKENTDLQMDGRNKQQLIVDSEIQIFDLKQEIAKFTEDLNRTEEIYKIQV